MNKTVSGPSGHTPNLVSTGMGPRGAGAPRTVSGLIPVYFYATDWFDDGGRKHSEIVQRIGNRWFLSPNGENYAASLRMLPLKEFPATGFTAEFLKLQAKRLAAIAPEADGADVFPSEPADEKHS